MRKILLYSVLLILSFHSSSALAAGCDLNKADTLFKSGKFREAAASYIKCARLEELNDKSDGDLIYKWYKEASYCYFASKDLNGALNTMEEALAWAKRNGNKRETAESHFNKGTILVHQRLLRDSVYSFEKALSVFREIDSSEDMVRSINKIASIKLAMERFSEAESLLSKSLEICEEKGLDQEKVEITRLFGDIFYSEGLFEEAEKSYMKSLKSYDSMGDNEKSGEIYEKLGDLKRDENQSVKAFELYTKAVDSYEKAVNPLKMNLAKFKTAFFYFEKGEHKKAREIFSPFIPEKRKKRDRKSDKKSEKKDIPRELIYFAFIGMGDLEKDLKNYKNSLGYYLNAIDAGYTGYEIDDEVSLFVKIAESLAFSGDYENALVFYQNAESKLTDIEGVKLKTDLCLRKGRLASSFRLYDSAINYYEDALSLNIDNKNVKSLILTKLGEIYYFKNDLILSEKMFKRAQTIVTDMVEASSGKENNKLKVLSGKIESFLFMTGFEKAPLESFFEYAGSQSSGSFSKEDLMKKLEGASFLFYKTVYGSGDIFGNIPKSTALVVINGNRVKGFRINHGIIKINTKKLPLKKLVSLPPDKRKDKLEYLLSSYKMLQILEKGKKRDRLKHFAEKQIFNILVKPCFNDLNGSKKIIIVADSLLLKDLDFGELNPGSRKLGEIFSVEKKDLNFLLKGKEKKK